MRSGGPMPRFSPRMVTLVHATPSLGEMPVTNGGWRARDIVAFGKQKWWAGQHLEKSYQYLNTQLKKKIHIQTFSVHLSLKRKSNLLTTYGIKQERSFSFAESADNSNFSDDRKTPFGWQTALFSHPVGLKQCMHCSSYLTDNMKNKEGSQERRSRQRAERKGRM